MNEFEIMSRLKTKRQKKRSIKDDKDKKLIQLDKLRDKLWDAKYSIPWVELEQPYQKGYERFFILREDVAISSRALFYENLLMKINTVSYSDNKKFLKRRRKNRRKVWTVRPQSLRKITESEWRCNRLKLTDDEKFYFNRVEKYSEKTKTKQVYYEFRETWRYVLKIIPHMITHYKPIDIEIEGKLKLLNNFFDRRHLHNRLCKIKSGKVNYRYWDNWDPFKEIKKEFLKIKKEKQWEVL